MPRVERTSYARRFFFISLLLLGSILWAAWDEIEGRRPWKKYQREFNRLEITKVEGDYEKERGRVGEESARLREEIARQSETLRYDEDYLSAQAQLERAQGRLQDVEIEKQFTRSELDEAYYEYRHALEGGATGVSERAQVDLLEEQIRGLEATEARLAAERDETRQNVRSLEDPLKDLEVEHREGTQKLDGLERRLTAIQGRTPEIQQIVIRGAQRNPFGEPVFIVDRCQTCHLAVDRSGFDDFPAPFQTHPQRELLLGKHPVEEFGCTLCHQGQGEALNSLEKAHGEVEFWERPLLRGPALESSCRKCHEGVADIPGAPVISQGKRLFVELGCTACHLAKGYEDVQKVGPSLLKSSQKFRPEWIVPWIVRPKDFLPKTRMPFFSLTEEESMAIAAFLQKSTEGAGPPGPLHFEPGPDPEAQAAEGAVLFRERGCLGCHVVDGEGGDFAPDLSQVAAKVNPDWLVNWIKDPKAYDPETTMPSLRLSDEEAQAITAFLLTKGEPRRPRPALEAQLQDPQQVAAGGRLVEQMGCYACHHIAGTEDLSRPSVELTTFANKRTEELDFGNVLDIPDTWEAWTFAKLKNPRIFSAGRIIMRMPNFDLSDAEATALLTLLRGLNGDEIPGEFLDHLTPREATLERGRQLADHYNCVGCHVIEGKGGEIQELYEDASLAPPSLDGEGEKVQPQWLFDFLKSPTPLRPWLKIRMPSFGLTDEAASDLVQYFSAQDETRDAPYVFVDEEAMSPGVVAVGKKIFQQLECLGCHVQTPGQAAADLAPDLSLARRRLRPDWLVKWLEDPQQVQPGTRMPAYFSDGESFLTEIWNGDAERQIRALRDYLMRFDGGEGEVTGIPPGVITEIIEEDE